MSDSNSRRPFLQLAKSPEFIANIEAIIGGIIDSGHHLESAEKFTRIVGFAKLRVRMVARS